MKKSLLAGIVYLSFLFISGTSQAALASTSKSIAVANGQSALHPIIPDGAVIAHRGASEYGPEHTFAAYMQAIKMKADYVEFDLQMTKDGQLIAMHDGTLARTTNARELYPNRTPWRVKDFTLAEIKKLDAGSWFNKTYPKMAKKEYASLKVPTLDEAIQYVRTASRGKAGLYMETKSPNIYPGMEEKVIIILKKNRVLNDRKLFLESFNEDRGPSTDLAVPIFMAAAHQNGLLVHPWVANQQAEMVSLLSLGVDAEFTNRPDLLRALKQKMYGD